MATWVIGDVQGCKEPLDRLLALIAFDPTRDQLWLAGDVVNRGPDSLGVLRWLVATDAAHPGSVATVLGNHDIHLLCRSEKLCAAKRRDTLDAVLAAPDLRKLTGWLLRQPLVARLDAGGRPLLLHGGLLPDWTAQFALDEAQIASGLLRGPQRRTVLEAVLDPKQPVPMAVRLAADFISVVTRLRCVSAQGEVCGTFAGAPEDAPAGFEPWYAIEGRKSADSHVLFGHWAALGVRRGPNWTSLDSGCVWGQRLTALCVETGVTASVPATPGQLG